MIDCVESQGMIIKFPRQQERKGLRITPGGPPAANLSIETSPFSPLDSWFN